MKNNFSESEVFFNKSLEILEPSDFIIHIDKDRKWEYDIPHSPSMYFRETVLMLSESIKNSY